MKTTVRGQTGKRLFREGEGTEVNVAANYGFGPPTRRSHEESAVSAGRVEADSRGYPHTPVNHEVDDWRCRVKGTQAFAIC